MVSRPVSPNRDSAALRRARIAVGALFLTNGAIFANLLPRYPEIKTDLHLGNAVYGAAVASFSAGALVAGLDGGDADSTVRQRAGRGDRHGRPGRVRRRSAVSRTRHCCSPPPCLWPGRAILWSTSRRTHMGCGCNANTAARSSTRCTAVWAAGAILGGLTGAGAIALGIPRGIQLSAVGVLLSAVALVAYRYLLPGPDHDDHPAAHASAAMTKAGPAGVPDPGGAGADRHCRRHGRGLRKLVGHAVSARLPATRHPRWPSSATSHWSGSCSSAGWPVTGWSIGSARPSWRARAA